MQILLLILALLYLTQYLLLRIFKNYESDIPSWIILGLVFAIEWTVGVVSCWLSMLRLLIFIAVEIIGYYLELAFIANCMVV